MVLKMEPAKMKFLLSSDCVTWPYKIRISFSWFLSICSIRKKNYQASNCFRELFLIIFFFFPQLDGKSSWLYVLSVLNTWFFRMQHVMRLVPKLRVRENRARADDRTPMRDITSRRLEHSGVILDRSEELWWQLPSFTSHWNPVRQESC